MKANIIYVDIESLFDLRQGVLGTLVPNKESVMEYLLSEEYNFRESDDLKLILPTAYSEALKEPSKDILEASCITRIFLCIKQKIESMEHRNKYYNESKEPQVLLNLYPFNFTEEEADHIRNLLFVKLQSDCIINITNLPMKSLSPYYCKSTGIVAAFIYRFKDWITEHSEAIKSTPNHDTLLYFPALYETPPTEDELKKIQKLGFKDPLSYTEYLFSSVASLNFLPVLFYSNLVTALSYLDKFDNQLKEEFVDEEAEEKYVDILSKVPVP